MRIFLSVLTALVLFAGVASAQLIPSGIEPASFTGDLFIGATKFYTPEGADEMKADALKDVAIGALYKFHEYDIESGDYFYNVALGAWVIYGYSDDDSQLAFAGGLSLLDGWLRIAAGYDVANEYPIYLIGTSFGVAVFE